MIRGRLASIVLALAAAIAPAAAETTRAKQAILIEHPGGRVLLQKSADKAMAPSSMTKLMTLYLAFEAEEGKRVARASTVTISKRAAAARGATLGLAAGDKVAFGDLVRAAAIASANDAAVAIAERLGRSEAGFAKTMTAKAQALGLGGSRFVNATGFAAKDHRMTAADVAKLASLVIERFPLHYGVFGERSFAFRGRSHANRNPLLGRYTGADGIKTGQTAAGGYGLVASAVRGNKRLILVVNGLPDEEARAVEARRLLDWGFAQLAR